MHSFSQKHRLHVSVPALYVLVCLKIDHLICLLVPEFFRTQIYLDRVVLLAYLQRLKVEGLALKNDSKHCSVNQIYTLGYWFSASVL